MNGSGLWHADQAWLGHRAKDVLIEVENGVIKSVREGVPAPTGSVRLPGWTIPGFANAHSHAFQRQLRGGTESGGGDFWEWRTQMYQAAEHWDPTEYFKFSIGVFREMLAAGITAVGEFHYLHRYGNELGDALIGAAREVGIRITLIDACYLRGGLDGRSLEGVQASFSDGDADRWVERVDAIEEHEGVRIGAAIHSVRAVDPPSMRIVAGWARKRNAPLHIHLAEQPAEVEECIAIEGCTPTQLLEREGILGPDLTAIHAIHLDNRDISLLGDNRVSICACPTTERDLGDHVGPIRRLAAVGSPLCLGSDSNTVIDMLEEARAVELDQRRATGRRVLHRPAELFEAATVGGMRALGWDAGEIKTGKLADFVCIEPAAGSARHLDLGGLIFGCVGGSECGVKQVVVGGTTVISS
ncbi:MAG TPA: formimidoylglutamate deiminase [Clostridia bacterium]|nr:formimidoylglutamate deiminase [Clostridia bacterium]